MANSDKTLNNHSPQPVHKLIKEGGYIAPPAPQAPPPPPPPPQQKQK